MLTDTGAQFKSTERGAPPVGSVIFPLTDMSSEPFALVELVNAPLNAKLMVPVNGEGRDAERVPETASGKVKVDGTAPRSTVAKVLSSEKPVNDARPEISAERRPELVMTRIELIVNPPLKGAAVQTIETVGENVHTPSIALGVGVGGTSPPPLLPHTNPPWELKPVTKEP
jgi:hypothetical protein